MGCSARCKKEFHRSSFGFQYEKPYATLTFQWPLPHHLYLAGRVAAAFYFTSVVIYGIITNANVYYPIYLTRWSIILLTVQTWIHLSCTFYHTFAENRLLQGFCPARAAEPKAEDTPLGVRVLWFFTTLTYNAAVDICIGYWTLVYNDEQDINYGLLSTHLINGIYVIVDLAVTGHPIRLYHVFYVMTFSALYTAFSAIYWAAGGTNEKGDPYVYSFLNWDDPKTSAIYAFAYTFIAIPVVHILLFVFYLIRDAIARKCMHDRWGMSAKAAPGVELQAVA